MAGSIIDNGGGNVQKPLDIAEHLKGNEVLFRVAADGNVEAFGAFNNKDFVMRIIGLGMVAIANFKVQEVIEAPGSLLGHLPRRRVPPG